MTTYLIIALVWLVSLGGAFWKGTDWQQTKDKADYATKLDEKIAEHNADSVIDMQAAAEWGERNGAARKAQDAAGGAIMADLRASPLPAVCVLSDRAVGLRNAAVDAANDSANPAGRVPDAVPPTPAPSIRGRASTRAVGNDAN